MKRLFSTLAMLLAAVTLSMTLVIGISSAYPELVNASVVTTLQNQEVSSQVEMGKDEVKVEELKLCKDESGVARECSDADFLKMLAESMGGLKGASALVLAFLISKLLLLLLLSPFFSNMFPAIEKGGIKLLIAVTLNLVVGVLSLMVPPVSLTFWAATTHSSVLALFSVFANQAYKQFLTPKGKS